MAASLDLTKLLREMDKAFVQREPLPDHFIKPLDQHTRETYAVMLAAIMLADGNLQENQSRLFSLLCTALGLPDGQTKALHQATQISSEHIVDFCCLAEEQNFAVSFLADGLILNRIDSPITHNQNQLLNQWCMLLRLPNSHIGTAVVAAANTLGIATSLSVDGDISINQFKVWSECIYRPLTIKDFVNGSLKTGYWKVNRNIVLEEAITLKNQAFTFKDNATLTFNHAFEIINCTFIKPQIITNINTENTQIYKIVGNTFLGTYKQSQLSTALKLKFNIDTGNNKVCQVMIEDNYFETVDARSIWLNSSNRSLPLELEILFIQNEFNNCGNNHLPGGAIGFANQSGYNLKIWNSSFANCKAFIGGALYIPLKGFYENCTKYTHPTINNCQFTKCSTYYFKSDKTAQKHNDALGGSGIWANYNYQSGIKNLITNCLFKDASVRLGDIEHEILYFKTCTFHNSIIASHNFYGYGCSLGEDCTPSISNSNLSLNDKHWYEQNSKFKKPESFKKFTYPMPTIWETSGLQ